jgi:hypothetical protein
LELDDIEARISAFAGMAFGPGEVEDKVGDVTGCELVPGELDIEL